MPLWCSVSGTLYSGYFPDCRKTVSAAVFFSGLIFMEVNVLYSKLFLVRRKKVDGLLKLLPIYCLSLASQIWLNYFNFKFIFSKIKAGDYTVPIFGNHIFQWLSTFTMAAWFFNAIFCYIPATIMISYSYRISLQNFNGLSSAVIVGQVASVLTSILFMRLMTGETLNRNGWIAIVIILLALPFAANASK